MKYGINTHTTDHTRDRSRSMILSTVGYGCSFLFYNSYLPILVAALPEVSSRLAMERQGTKQPSGGGEKDGEKNKTSAEMAAQMNDFYSSRGFLYGCTFYYLYTIKLSLWSES